MKILEKYIKAPKNYNELILKVNDSEYQTSLEEKVFILNLFLISVGIMSLLLNFPLIFFLFSFISVFIELKFKKIVYKKYIKILYKKVGINKKDKDFKKFIKENGDLIVKENYSNKELINKLKTYNDKNSSLIKEINSRRLRDLENALSVKEDEVKNIKKEIKELKESL